MNENIDESTQDSFKKIIKEREAYYTKQSDEIIEMIKKLREKKIDDSYINMILTIDGEYSHENKILYHLLGVLYEHILNLHSSIDITINKKIGTMENIIDKKLIKKINKIDAETKFFRENDMRWTLENILDDVKQQMKTLDEKKDKD
jgi:hypothetical protein